MSDSAAPRFTLPVLAAVLILGCGRSDNEAPMIPLGQAGAPDAGPMTGEAKVALDSANILFRTRAYDLALAQYRRSAQLVPTDVTPLLGVLMVAEATKNSRLADSTLARLRELQPGAADSLTTMGHAEMIDLHSRVGGSAASPP